MQELFRGEGGGARDMVPRRDTMEHPRNRQV